MKKVNNILACLMCVLILSYCSNKTLKSSSSATNKFTIKGIDSISLNTYYIFYVYNHKHEIVKVLSERKPSKPCQRPILIGGKYEFKLEVQGYIKPDTSMINGGRFRLNGFKAVFDSIELFEVGQNEVVYTTFDIYNNCYMP